MKNIYTFFVLILFLFIFNNFTLAQSLMDDELTLIIKEGTKARVSGDYKKALKVLSEHNKF